MESHGKMLAASNCGQFMRNRDSAFLKSLIVRYFAFRSKKDTRAM